MYFTSFIIFNILAEDMQKNLHDKPFDEGTITKLNIFEAYAKAWLPTFIMNVHEPNIYIFDLFAGPGYSITRQEGSAIRLMKQINNQIGNIFIKKKKVFILFNELDKEKAKALKQSCDAYIESHTHFKRAIESKLINIRILQVDVAELYPRIKPYIGKFPLLLFFDQNGIKFMADEYFLPLLTAKKVDFLFYLSSSYFIRFGKTEEFRNVIDIDIDKAKQSPYKCIHRRILDQLRLKIPKNSQTRLYPFTIKKGSNVYGIIFGASHPLAVEKFLKAAWQENNINGEANFDIDDDANKGQPNLFGDCELTKIMKFNHDIREAIINRKVKTNKDAYDFALNHGHLPMHAANEIKQMRKEKIINYFGRSPCVTYEKAYKNKMIIEYQVL